MKRSIRTIAAIAFAIFGFCSAAGAEIVTIDIPDARDVFAYGLNDKGQVTGSYDGQHVDGSPGFIWRPGGKLVTFSVPGAAATGGVVISATGVVTGTYAVGRVPEGFARAADGTITTFSAPDGRYTGILGGNRKGWSVGGYASKSAPGQPFFRNPSGTLTEFTVPGATTATAVAINRSQTIAGSSSAGAFIRAKSGAFTLFGDKYTTVGGINDAGTVAGIVGGDGVGYLRASDGTITTFAFPAGADRMSVSGINNSGTVVGFYYDSSNLAHGFIRTADGTFTSFDPAGAAYTFIRAINNTGEIAGSYLDADGIWHGFFGTP